MTSYFAIHTSPNREASVARRLQDKSYVVYFPRVLTQVHHARRLHDVPRPLFPRYMFVGVDGRGVSDIKRTDGVNDVVRSGNGPAFIRPNVIAQIKAREGTDGFVRLDNATVLTSPFRPGQLLRLHQDGPFDGIDVVFHKMKGETRALVFFGMLTLEAQKHQLERVA